jgi:hypothetical protein
MALAVTSARTVILGLVIAASAVGVAPTTAAQEQKPSECPIALPYRADGTADCSPRGAAAYDFAFCAAYLSLTASSISDTNTSESLKRRGTAYFNVSEAFSSAETLKKNVTLIKEYFDSLEEQKHLIRSVATYIAGLTLVRADARKREWFAYNGDGMRAVSRAPRNKALAISVPTLSVCLASRICKCTLRRGVTTSAASWLS